MYKYLLQVPDEYANALVSILKNVLDEVIKEMTVDDFHLETYTSSNFMGFFLSDQGSSFLKKIAVLYAEKITDLGKFNPIFTFYTNILFIILINTKQKMQKRLNNTNNLFIIGKVVYLYTSITYIIYVADAMDMSFVVYS